MMFKTQVPQTNWLNVSEPAKVPFLLLPPLHKVFTLNHCLHYEHHYKRWLCILTFFDSLSGHLTWMQLDVYSAMLEELIRILQSVEPKMS